MDVILAILLAAVIIFVILLGLVSLGEIHESKQNFPLPTRREQEFNCAELELDDLDLDEFDLDDEELDVEEDEDEWEKSQALPLHKPHPTPALSAAQAYYVGEKCIGLSPRKGYSKLALVGMYFQKLGSTHLGKFEGYAQALTEHPVDPHAIAIYREDGLQLGYLPRGNKALHQLIRHEGGKVHCYGYLACARIHPTSGKPVKHYAEVCVETDRSQVVLRNKPYDTEDKFYPYETGLLQKLLETSQQAKD
ncbi:MAG: hypothetical protein IKZ12_03825 [Alistipes sp.]|nr:hypothetical protein [Alistipes sp.]